MLNVWYGTYVFGPVEGSHCRKVTDHLTRWQVADGDILTVMRLCSKLMFRKEIPPPPPPPTHTAPVLVREEQRASDSMRLVNSFAWDRR